MKKTRFAPSPTGYLHLGHAYSALKCWNWAQNVSGELLLRVEDIDVTRCRKAFVEGIFEDLSWMGLSWSEPVRYQSQHQLEYKEALAKLKSLGVLYPCTCSRKDIEKALSAPHVGDHPLYPGTCRKTPPELRPDTSYALRLDVEKALHLTGPLMWEDEQAGIIKATPHKLGDVVLARKDSGTSYHLSVVVDDGIQEIDTVIRGMDLSEVTHIHRLLQALLGLPTPLYHHHALLLDEQGQRLAKRSGGALIKNFREQGLKHQQLFERLNLFPD